MYLCRKTEVNCGKLPLPLLSIVDDMRTKLTKHWCRHFMLHKVDSFFVLCTFLGVGGRWGGGWGLMAIYYPFRDKPLTCSIQSSFLRCSKVSVAVWQIHASRRVHQGFPVIKSVFSDGLYCRIGSLIPGSTLQIWTELNGHLNDIQRFSAGKIRRSCITTGGNHFKGDTKVGDQ